MNLFMSIIRALKWFFLPKEGEKKPVRLHHVTDEQLIARLQRGMPLEHITCDEYVPVPKDKKVVHFGGLQLTEKAEPEKKVRVKVPKQKAKATNFRTGSYEEQIDADNYISGYKCIPQSVTTSSVHPSYSSGFTPDLLKEALADAKAVRETARINAKIAMEEAFGKEFKKKEKEERLKKADEAFLNNRKYVINDEVIRPKLPFDVDDTSYLDKAIRQRRVKAYDDEKW
jgi:hypothetical protein